MKVFILHVGMSNKCYKVKPPAPRTVHWTFVMFAFCGKCFREAYKWSFLGGGLQLVLLLLFQHVSSIILLSIVHDGWLSDRNTSLYNHNLHERRIYCRTLVLAWWT